MFKKFEKFKKFKVPQPPFHPTPLSFRLPGLFLWIISQPQTGALAGWVFLDSFNFFKLCKLLKLFKLVKFFERKMKGKRKEHEGHERTYKKQMKWSFKMEIKGTCKENQ